MSGPATKLGAKLAGITSGAEAPAATPLGRRLVVDGRRGEEVTLPELGRVYLQLPGARAWQEVEAAIKSEMRRLEIGELNVLNAANYQAEQALRVLAIAARDPDDHDKPYGTLDQWGELDNDLVNIAWHAFGDMRERLDPIAMELSEDERFSIQSAVKKKDAGLLRTYGVAKLSLWLATTVDPPSTSPTPSSPSSDSASPAVEA